MEKLTDDEFTVLLIAKTGQSIGAIGRWEIPVDSLVRLGFLKRGDKFNNYITPAGEKAVDERENEDARALIGAMAPVPQVQEDIQDFVQQAAQILAKAAKASSILTGDAEKIAARKWGALIIERACELL
jgi:hypothetical protein